MNIKYALVLLFVFVNVQVYCFSVSSKSNLPLLSIDPKARTLMNQTDNTTRRYLPFIMLIEREQDTSEYWRETEILTLVRHDEEGIDYEKCEQNAPEDSALRLPARRTVRPICRTAYDFQLCPQCPRFSNRTECELFKDSCRERPVIPSEYRTYCDQKYGKWRTMFLPADYSQCRCCDECIFYRELDQSCMEDEYSFDTEEFLPVTTVDFRAGCNPYWGHPEQEVKALRCDPVLRRCVPVTIPMLPRDTLNVRRSFRYEPPTGEECPVSCRGYDCQSLVHEDQCPQGAFLPDKDYCNCCGRCSSFFQLNQKCAEFKKTLHKVNATEEIEIEEEFLEPGCDDGLVCRQGICQDTHSLMSRSLQRLKREQLPFGALEPCKQEMKYFKKKYGVNGHLHHEAPQCTPLWLYAPVQCRRFVCYCALEDGSRIDGIKVPRVEVSNMNCDCAREKCRTESDVQCDGYGNYKEAVFMPHVEQWPDPEEVYESDISEMKASTKNELK
ncbi:PREDICTED: uncharacterized protein LOC106102860 isoform X1 [Papilio polytes]|uniref:uncharacterized protein LOC106102860 isoform X1 n=2 Tax=Papilio polytes TaxID=76194 RepID=UPI000675C44B|nr:PREDICTED: uncharacterized protein LOC106102860 isoform X1 [Papilio polytes]